MITWRNPGRIAGATINGKLVNTYEFNRWPLRKNQDGGKRRPSQVDEKLILEFARDVGEKRALRRW